MSSAAAESVGWQGAVLAATPFPDLTFGVPALRLWYIMDLADLMRTELKYKGFNRGQGFCERTLARRIRLSRPRHETGA